MTKHYSSSEAVDDGARTPALVPGGHRRNAFVTFILEDRCFGISIKNVERITHAVFVTPLPNAPEIVIGVFSLHGRIIPVVNARRRFRMADRDIAPGDQFIIAWTAKHAVALVADLVTGVIELSDQDIVCTEGIVPGIENVAGIAKFGDDLVLIQDLDRFLSLDEASALEKAIRQEGADET